MRCREFEARLGDLLDGALTSSIAARCREHAADCEGCCRLLEEHDDIHGLLSGHWRQAEAPEGILQAVKAQAGPPPRRRPAWWGPQPLVAGLAVAAAIALYLPGYLAQPHVAPGGARETLQRRVAQAPASPSPSAPTGLQTPLAQTQVDGQAGADRRPAATQPRVVKRSHRIRHATQSTPRRTPGGRHGRGGSGRGPQNSPADEPSLYSVAMLPLGSGDTSTGSWTPLRVESSVVTVDDPDTGERSTVTSSRVVDAQDQVRSITLDYSSSRADQAPPAEENADESRRSMDGPGAGSAAAGDRVRPA